MKISVGISNHHVHLTEEDFKLLFGEDAVLDVEREINQPEQYASSKRVDIEGPKGKLRDYEY